MRLIFWPNSEIQTFQRGLFSYGGGAIFNFSHKIGLKSTKNVRFCILHKPMGGLEPPRPPPPPPWLRYCTRVLLYAKMLQETEYVDFCHIFISVVISIEGAGPLGPPSWLRLCLSRAHGTVPYSKSGPSYCITFIKR